MRFRSVGKKIIIYILISFLHSCLSKKSNEQIKKSQEIESQKFSLDVTSPIVSGRWFDSCESAESVLKWNICKTEPNKTECVEAADAVELCQQDPNDTNSISKISGRWFDDCESAESVLKWNVCKTDSERSECVEAAEAVDICKIDAESSLPLKEVTGRWFDSCEGAENVLKWKVCETDPERLECVEAADATNICSDDLQSKNISSKKIYYLKNSGDDKNDCLSKDRPCQSLSKVLDLLMNGDDIVFIPNFIRTLYVKNGGNDKNSCLSDSLACSTFNGALSKANSGDRILFKRGSKWFGYNSIDKSVFIDAYGQGNNPVFDGQQHSMGNSPSIFNIKANDVTLSNLDVRNSGGRGVHSFNVSNILIDKLSIDSSYDQAIILRNGSNFVVRNSTVNKTAQGFIEFGEAKWSAAVVVQGANRYLVEKNIVTRTGGEGINQTNWSKGGVVRNNLVYAARAVGIYCDFCTNLDVYNNTILGTSTEKKYWRLSNSVGSGMAINVEAYHIKNGERVTMANINFFNNLVANTGSGFSIYNNYLNTLYSSVKFFNNTLVENNIGITNSSGNSILNSFEVRNNIIISGNQSLSSGNLQKSGLILSNNYWEGGKNYPGLGNIYAGTKLKRTSGWRSISGPLSITSDDFRPISGGSWIKSGFNKNLFTDYDSKKYLGNLGAFQSEN